MARTSQRGKRQPGPRRTVIKLFRVTEAQGTRLVGLAEQLDVDDSALIRAAIFHVIDLVEAGEIDPGRLAKMAEAS